jgi:SPX domain protein involved in polyphosphate accumulation
MASIKKKLIGESKSAEQQEQEKTFAQRILEKTRQRQLKQKQYRKEHDLKLAFSEFYLSLILLQNYQTLNFTGFRKILKKHDKVNFSF